jgi:LDH2 family malate/lactate/ureidoglycolate dehydrogenase
MPIARAPAFDGVCYSAEIEAKNDPRRRHSGITLPDDTVADLTQLARERPG